MWRLLWGCVLALLPTVARADAINLQLSTEFRTDDFTQLTITTANVGEIAARQVTAETLFGGERQNTDTVETLAPGERKIWAVTIPPVPGPGTFPLKVGLRYVDANDYPSSALLVHLVRSPGAPASPVHARVEISPTAGIGSGTFHLENPLSHPLRGRVTLVLPREFTAEPPVQDIELQAQERMQLPLSLSNSNALLGSRYPATALFEYDDDNVHYTVAANTVFDVNYGPTDRSHGWMIAAGGAVLLLALIAVALGLGRRPSVPEA